MRLDGVGCAFPCEAALAGNGLGLHADGLGVEILRAGEHGAQVALAAVERAGDHGVGALGEAQRLHGAVRLDGMAEQVARAELGAEAALVAGRAADPGTCSQGALWRRMSACSAGRTMMPPVVLVTGTLRSAAGLRHHDAAEEHAEIVDRGSAGGVDDFADGDADGNAEGDRLGDGAGDGEVLVRDGAVEADVHEGLDVGDDGVDVFGQAARRDDAAGDHGAPG